MRRLSSLAWRSLGSRKLRSFLTTAGIALGVAVLFASLSAGVTMDAAVDKAAADEMGRADLRVGSLEEQGLTQATIDVITHVAGVSVAALRGVGVSESVSVGGGSGAAAEQADSRNTNISNAKHWFIFSSLGRPGG